MAAELLEAFDNNEGTNKKKKHQLFKEYWNEENH